MIRWDGDKAGWLWAVRGVSFQELADRIVAGDFIDILESPARAGQEVFVLTLRHYTWAVPFVVAEDGHLFLKTALPSRKFHRRYGGHHGEAGTAGLL